MGRIEDAVERIKALECPTGDVENRVERILEDYGVVNRDKITVMRDKSLDRDGAEAYCAKITGSGGQSVVILTKSGMDDYVAKVVDAYID